MARSLTTGITSLRHDSVSVSVILSYAFDWLVLIVVLIAAVLFNKITPNKRPFSLSDPDISFPFSETEACPSWLLVVLIFPVPVVIIAFTSLILTPGPTVPKRTANSTTNVPSGLIWKRKLWELHIGLLGLALSVVAAYFFTQGMKNMFGKPRPDLLSRCQPDFTNRLRYRIGGFSDEDITFALYSADICQQTDTSKLNDGFRSYPSGHSSSSAAALVYLSLYLASKLSVAIPFAGWKTAFLGGADAAAHVAFPSRLSPSSPNSRKPQLEHHDAYHNHTNDGIVQSSPTRAAASPYRRKAAAPPIYLLVLVLIPFGASIWVAASRWYDFRHHGFDILFGYSMGVITAVFSFRYYHIPLQEGAGWAWGPRSRDRAFWAGVGRLGYVGDRDELRELDGRDGGQEMEVHGGNDPLLRNRGSIERHEEQQPGV